MVEMEELHRRLLLEVSGRSLPGVYLTLMTGFGVSASMPSRRERSALVAGRDAASSDLGVFNAADDAWG